MTTSTSIAREIGQETSIADLRSETIDRFLARVAAVLPGREFTVNDLREFLDTERIPPKSRAGLFAAATKAGLITAAMFTVAGRAFPMTVPSTGQSARHATVRVYRRTHTQL